MREAMKTVQKPALHTGSGTFVLTKIMDVKLNPAIPRVLCRLIHLGQTAGLILRADQDLILSAFSSEARTRESVGPVLAQFQCSVTELYILVMLFFAKPRPVPVEVLERETLVPASQLRAGLNHLDELELISVMAADSAEPLVQLTPSGSDLAMWLIYRVIAAIV
jgi:hypothetical protein